MFWCGANFINQTCCRNLALQHFLLQQKPILNPTPRLSILKCPVGPLCCFQCRTHTSRYQKHFHALHWECCGQKCHAAQATGNLRGRHERRWAPSQFFFWGMVFKFFGPLSERQLCDRLTVWLFALENRKSARSTHRLTVNRQTSQQGSRLACVCSRTVHWQCKSL